MNHSQQSSIQYRESSYLRAYKPPLHLSRTLYKSAHFIQFKPNFRKAKMNANAFSQKDYENETAFRLQKNKPNQSQWASKFHPLMVKTGSSFVAANTASMFLLSPGSKLM